MKGDAQLLLWALIGTFLFVVIAGWLLMYPAFVLSFHPQSLPNTDISKIPFASWLPSSAVFVEGYMFPCLMDATYKYKVTIARSDLERFMQHTPDWEEGNLVDDVGDDGGDWLKQRWPELCMARKCYSYSTRTGYGFDAVTVCSDDSDVSTIYIEKEIR
ncbi:MAG: hypothetical protein KAW89_00885 [Armatimonadetes bacterium]|nr:hypothetical protein [Armatimonadota bacterium]